MYNLKSEPVPPISFSERSLELLTDRFGAVLADIKRLQLSELSTSHFELFLALERRICQALLLQEQAATGEFAESRVA